MKKRMLSLLMLCFILICLGACGVDSKEISASETTSLIEVEDLEPLTIRAIRSSSAPSGGAFVKKTWVNANPWTEDTDLSALPVFVYTWERAENNTDEDYAAMETFLVEAAEFFGFKTTQYEIKNMISQLCAELDGMWIYVDDEMKTRIYFEQGVSLPSKYNLSKEASYEEKREAAEYIRKKYKKIINMEDPQINVRDGENNNISLFEGADNLADRIVNYNFKRTDFYIDKDGLITSIIIYRPDLSQKVGDYPIISADEAKELLGEGHYYGADNFPGVEWVKHVELVYDTGSSHNVLMPYYSFYAGSLYYVPAIDPQYITNMPVNGRYPDLWDGLNN